MRRSLPLIVLSIASICAVRAAAEKLTEQERIELIRGLSSEYAKAKVALPRSKALALDTKGAWDKNAWAEASRQYGPAARVGDMVQLTAVDIQADRIVFAINGGFYAGKTRWFHHIQAGAGGGMAPVAKPNAGAPPGTSIVLVFNAPVPEIKAAEVKKMLSTVLDFEQRSATQTYFESLPPEMQQAVKDKRVLVGMNRDEVLAAVGKPVRKVRDVNKNGDETEDWIYGVPPGKIVFVTFRDAKVIKVREDYAGLGTEAPATQPPR